MIKNPVRKMLVLEKCGLKTEKKNNNNNNNIYIYIYIYIYIKVIMNDISNTTAQYRRNEIFGRSKKSLQQIIL